MSTQPVGLIGGTGNEGRGIALRLAQAGHTVLIGSRETGRATETANTINRGTGSQRARGVANADLFDPCRLLFLSVPFEHAASFVEEHRECFREDHVLVDVTVPLRFQKGPRLLPVEAGSAAEQIRRSLPETVPMVATFKTLPAALLQELGIRLDGDEIVCHDSPQARDLVLSVLKTVPGIRWLDGGPLRYCRALEAMTMLVIGLNRRYHSHHGRFRVLGI